ncbi:hypothetical protein [Corynebacterium nasicanis]|uniref:Uncharacterized protein n=1 Tax=Corynebacterium nasicanis TaxID=1448267 RepID=A0ABW1QAP4_9CORY
MHYTSWDRSDVDRPVLLAEGGPEVLARFGKDTAEVDGATWTLVFDAASGATATLIDVPVLTAEANFKKDKSIPVNIGTRSFVLVNEASNNWIIDDENGNKVAQFSGGNNGVRQAILEFEGETDLPRDAVVGLSWMARLLLEQRLSRSSTAVIATLALMTLAAILAFLF